MNPTDPGVSGLLQMFGGVSAAGVLGWVVWYLLTKTIPSLQKTFEDAIAKRDERDQQVRAQHDALHARLIDALLDLKQSKNG